MVNVFSGMVAFHLETISEMPITDTRTGCVETFRWAQMSSRSLVQKTGRATQSRSKALPFPQTPEGSRTIEAAQQEAADYIAHMTAELASIAISAQLDLVSYFLKMAQMQAEDFLNGESRS